MFPLVIYVPGDPRCSMARAARARYIGVTVFFRFFSKEGIMAYGKRKRMSRRSSRRAFRNGAMREHPRNRMDSRNFRGGIRL